MEFFGHPEGYVRAENGTYGHVYQYKDHLGNVRLSYTEDPSDPGTPTIIEEDNYYPFGLKHMGYNGNISPLGNSAAKKFKYNGQEFEENLSLNLYEMDVRSYDPAIARFTSIDPVTHNSIGTYVAFDNNPAFWADPSGADSWTYVSGGTYKNNQTGEETNDWQRAIKETQSHLGESPVDDITVNSKGIVTKVVKNNRPNRFFDEQGNELKFNDPSGVDGQYMPDEWRRGDRLYYPITTEEMNQEIIDSGIIFQRWMANYNIGGTSSGLGFWLWSLVEARDKGHGNYDFAEKYLVNRIDNPSINMERNRSESSFNDGSGFFRFENTNNIYNLYDGSNYMWGRAMSISGFSYGEARLGSQANEVFRDTEADQRAIKNGFYGS